MSRTPLIVRDERIPFAYVSNKAVLPREFAADCLAAAGALPEGRYLINLCEDRYLFTVCFFAAALRRQTNLLPNGRNAAAIEALTQTYPDSYIASDNPALGTTIELQPGANGEADSPQIDDAQVMCIAFTSGSTGEPQAHSKTWEMLSTWRHWHHDVLEQAGTGPWTAVATVPSWHMYGLEWAMLLPTAAPVAIYCGADFYPDDVLAALGAHTDAQTLLIATPTHLRALAKARRGQDAINVIMSATAPLDAATAVSLEVVFAASVLEIYGCSEIGSLAERSTANETAWQFFPGFALEADPAGSLTVNAAQMPVPVTLSDQFAVTSEGRYELLGRNSDMVKIGGKRESLARLNQVLLHIEGVSDGVIYDPEQLGMAATGRLAAVVVAPDLDTAAIRRALAQHIDPVFVPRSVRFVESLPREATSKLPVAALKNLVTDRG